ncbi:DUF6636 domain-containing protein [Actinoplanes sp. NPDC049118]|uniref:DUF6636 domain-containing protein n=1 Tax=Actinoplanes sp. NPDC049118 TaxID=3155769 RepID=UPI0033DDF581
MALGRGWAAVLLMLALGACTAPRDTPDPSPPTPASAGLGDAPAMPTATVTEANFVSPSGNIGCYVDKDGARCDIVKKAWKPPPAPTDCELDWAGGISVYQAEEAAFTCAGDTVLGAKETLKYGDAVRAGDFMCGSDRKAMRCMNTATGHGFTLSVEQYNMF